MIPGAPLPTTIVTQTRPLTDDERQRFTALLPATTRNRRLGKLLLVAAGVAAAGVVALLVALSPSATFTGEFLVAMTMGLVPAMLLIAGLALWSWGKSQRIAIPAILAQGLAWQVSGITVMAEETNRGPVWRYGRWTLIPADFRTGNEPLAWFEFVQVSPSLPDGGGGYLLTVNGRPVQQLCWNPSLTPLI